ncbi:MAG TPA: alpha/beta hydrolase [Puia sp.]|nr:alpha/beta hydrolase [Puia sp.]
MNSLFSISPIRAVAIIALSLLLGGRTQLHAQSLTATRVNTHVAGKPSFAVQKEGHGRPMIFIPGLYCSGDVWKDAVKHFSQHYTCYTLTLPGFAGQPPIRADSILIELVHELAAYIRQEKLEKPVIVGHSLGGYMALAFGVYHPELAGDLVIVSSAPFLPALAMSPDVTVDSAGKIGLMIKKAMVVQTPAQIKQYQQYTLATMIRDTARMAPVIEMAVRSDPATQGEIMYELFSQDLRPMVGKIHSRVLALADWSAYKQYGASAESVKTNLQGQYKLLGPGLLTIDINDLSKHFIMFDEPDWMYSQMDNFLK